MSWLLWFGGVLLFLFILLASVGLHEAGHMVAAKKLGVKVPEFFIGFGTKLWSFKRNGTEYGIRMIPAGGYVRLEDESIEKGKPERELLSNVAPWRRQLIFFAGPLVNLVLGFALLFGTTLAYPYDQPNTSIDRVNSCSVEEKVCGAEKAGILPGDKVLSIDGQAVEKHTDFNRLSKDKNSIDIEVLRAGEHKVFHNVPLVDNRFGVFLQWEQIRRTPGEAAGLTVEMTGRAMMAIADIPSQIPGLVATVFQGADRDPESAGSVVGAGKTYGDVAATDKLDNSSKVQMFLVIAGALNLSLGFINLIPIGMLDGSKMLMAFVDTIRLQLAKLRKRNYTPVSYSVIKWVTLVPTLAILGLMVLLIAADLVAPINVLGP